MTKYLDANFVPWAMEDWMRSVFRNPTPRTETDAGHFLQPTHNTPPESRLENMTQMPTDGNIVGVIVHVRNNTTPVGKDTRYNAVIGTSDLGVSNEVITITPVTAIVPENQTGFFFSDPDVAEFDRAFLKDDYLGIQLQRDALGNYGNGFGTYQVTCMMAYELKTT